MFHFLSVFGYLWLQVYSVRNIATPTRLYSIRFFKSEFPAPKISTDKKFWMLVSSVRHLPRFRDIRTHRTVFTTMTTPAYQCRLRRARNSREYRRHCSGTLHNIRIVLMSVRRICTSVNGGMLCSVSLQCRRTCFVPAAAEIGRLG